MLNARTLALKLEYHLFKKEGALLQRFIPVKTQAVIRRLLRAKYLLWDARRYRSWLDEQRRTRQLGYSCALENGLLSLLTPVWDGTPLAYFRLLAESIIEQNSSGTAEWVILDNGCQNRVLLDFLAALQQYSWITIARAATNAGIVGGLRLCLEAASGRYVLPVDSDDWLYADCLQIVTWWLREKGFPPLLYTDEDKLIGKHAVQPYLKPDFDPVLLLNSAYIAHLGVIDRKLALAHDAYADKSTEGSPDWDLFARFFAAGQPAVHIPEIVYSWRMHPESTADDASSKPYIHSSQKAVLQRYLDTTGFAKKFDVEYSPLLKNSCDWWVRRRAVDPCPALLVSLTTGDTVGQAQPLDYPDLPRLSLPVSATVRDLAELIATTSKSEKDLVCLVSDDLTVDRLDWLWEALGLLERFPDTAMVGARIRNGAGLIMSGGQVLGFGRACDCPDRGRPALDPGYFTQMLKQRSVSAVSSQFAVIRAGVVSALARQFPQVRISLLGPWAGAWALRTRRRIIYSPFISGVSDIDWDAMPTSSEISEFRTHNIDLMPDHRFYPAGFGLQPARAYRLPD